MKRIKLTQGQFALVDDADYDWLDQFRWYAYQGQNTWYASRSQRIKGKNINIKMHRVILGLKRGDKHECDHRNCNGLDNQRLNLRVCTHQQNQFNRGARRGGSSKFKGLSLDKRKNKWHAQIRYGKDRIHLGYFLKERDAAKAYDKATKKYFGEFARLNFAEV